jgi:hypothetical protein
MRAALSLALIAALSSCDSPAPGMGGGERWEVTRNGRSYIVYLKDEQVEVIRMGYARRGEHQAIRAEMIDMIPVVTGCRLSEGSLRGDSGEMRGRVNCPN